MKWENRERSSRKKLLKRISFGNWVFIGMGFIVFVVVCFVIFIKSLNDPYHRMEKEAIQLAQQSVPLVDAKANQHTWNETVWVVSGHDDLGQERLVFERKAELMVMKQGEYVNKSQMMARFRAEQNRSILWMEPGWFKDQPAWEIGFFCKPGEVQHCLNFYSLKEGILLKKYSMSL